MKKVNLHLVIGTILFLIMSSCTKEKRFDEYYTRRNNIVGLWDCLVRLEYSTFENAQVVLTEVRYEKNEFTENGIINTDTEWYYQYNPEKVIYYQDKFPWDYVKEYTVVENTHETQKWTAVYNIETKINDSVITKVSCKETLQMTRIK